MDILFTNLFPRIVLHSFFSFIVWIAFKVSYWFRKEIRMAALDYYIFCLHLTSTFSVSTTHHQHHVLLGRTHQRIRIRFPTVSIFHWIASYGRIFSWWKFSVMLHQFSILLYIVLTATSCTSEFVVLELRMLNEPQQHSYFLLFVQFKSSLFHPPHVATIWSQMLIKTN